MSGNFPQSGFGVLVFGAAAEEFPFPLGQRESCSRLAKTNQFLELSSLGGRSRVNCLRETPKLAAPPSPSSYIPQFFDPKIPQQHWCRFPGFSPLLYTPICWAGTPQWKISLASLYSQKSRKATTALCAVPFF